MNPEKISIRKKYDDRLTEPYKKQIEELVNIIESAGNPSSFNYPSSMIPGIIRRAKLFYKELPFQKRDNPIPITPKDQSQK